MVVLIIIFVILFIVLPRLTPYILRWAIRRQAKRMAQQFAAQTGAPFGNNDPRRNATQQQPRKTSKKIDPDVGEYVRFEEIKEPRTDTRTEQKPFTVEEQIVDVEWEDLPPENK